MTPLPAKYVRILRGQAAPTSQLLADQAERMALLRWCVDAHRCVSPLSPSGLCCNSTVVGVLCDQHRRSEG